MGTIEENRIYYDNYDWERTGENWASRWGGSDIQWYGTILPRIQTFLPAKTILEIGAGQGRLSQFLLSYCNRLIVVDMTKCCVEACRTRFAGNLKVECIRNDGLSLAGVEPASVDFIFSFFSLVHADVMTMKSYVFEMAEKLSPNGVAFIHHSNAGAYYDAASADEEYRFNDYRDMSVSAELIREIAREAEMTCRSQELFGWDSDQLLTDCFSVVTSRRSPFARRNTIICNWDFPFEAEKLGQLSEAYGASGYLP